MEQWSNAAMADPAPQHSTTPSLRILVVKPSSLGDVLHALPTVARIRRRYPDAHLAWLINAELSPLLARCPLLNERIEFHRRAAGAWLPLLARLRRERFDLVVDLQGLFRSGVFTWATRAPRRVGLSDAREGARLAYTETVPVTRAHAVDRYLKVADHLGCPASPVEFPLGVTGSRGSLIAVNPSARWATKLWGDDRFAELIRQLPRERVVVTGSAADAARCQRIAQGARNLAGKTTLLELAELYRQCAVLITNDSGPMHLAAAVGTPVVAIFGPTDPALTGPYGSGHTVLQAGLTCVPCLRDRCRHTPALECMAQVTVAQVLAAVERFR
jgi:lipopolysaccharide heptosyltransferase I